MTGMLQEKRIIIEIKRSMSKRRRRNQGTGIGGGALSLLTSKEDPQYTYSMRHWALV